MTPISVLFSTALLAVSPVSSAPAAPAAESRPVYAHRGGTSSLVENTRANYAHAAAHGSLLWETDVRFTRTNYPVLLHNADLGRFRCASIKIANVSVPAARRCTAANGQSISTLHEFVTDLSARRARALIELKTVPTAAQWKILQTRIAPVKSRIVIESFLPAAVVAASKKGYRTAFLTRTAVAPKNLPAGTDWYSAEYTSLTTAKVRAMQAAGVKVSVWTVPCAKWATLPAGVDTLISNDLVEDCA